MNEATRRRRHLLAAQMMLERAELKAELAELRHATAAPQLARGLFGSVIGPLAGSGLAAPLLGALLGRLGRRRAAPAPSAPSAGPMPAALLAQLLRPYPVLATAASTLASLWPMLGARGRWRRTALVAVAGAVAFFVWRARQAPPAERR